MELVARPVPSPTALSAHHLLSVLSVIQVPLSTANAAVQLDNSTAAQPASLATPLSLDVPLATALIAQYVT